MKDKIILLILGLFVVASCKDDDMPTEPDGIYFGTGAADLNGGEWEGDTRTKMAFQSNTHMLLNIDHIVNKVLKGTLNFKYVPLKAGQYELKPSELNKEDTVSVAYNTRIGDGDVAGNYYILLTNDTVQDWIEIVAFDDATMEFNGKFQASFYRDTTLPKFDQSLPDTLVFTNGTFNGKVTK